MNAEVMAKALLKSCGMSLIPAVDCVSCVDSGVENQKRRQTDQQR